MSALGLTDRDGVYGAVRFAKACRAADIRPVLGTDLAVRPTSLEVPRGGAVGAAGRSPARGGAFLDPGLPRVTLLAGGREGWGALCRLVTATHLAGERGQPVTTLELIAEHVALAAERGGALLVLLGRNSEVGRAVAARRPDQALALLQRWRSAVPEPGDLLAEVTSHRAAGDAAQAGRLAAFAAEVRLPAVLTNEVRYADRSDAPVADVLDSARRLVALDPRHVDRRNAEGYLKSGKEMAEVAEEVARFAGLGDHGRGLLVRTGLVADRCALDPRADLGIGEVHFPELGAGSVGGPGAGTSGGDADAVLRERCLAGLGRRGMTGSPELLGRLDDELGVIRTLGYPSYFLTVADVVDLIRGMGVRCAARGSGAGSLVTYLTRDLRRRPDALRAADGALPLPVAPPAARHRHRRGVGPPYRGLREGARPLRR